MWSLIFGISFFTSMGVAQAPDSLTNQKILEELQGVQATLARVIEVLEKGQRAQLILVRIQIDQGRAAALESQRIQLLEQERDLEKESTEAAALARAQDSGLLRTAPGAPNTINARKDQASRKLEEVRRMRTSVEQELTALRNRIATMEKSLEEALR